MRTSGPKGLYAVELHADPKTKTTTTEGEEPRVYTWDDQGHAVKEALPDGTVLEERAYDQDGYLIAEVNGAGEGVQYWHDMRGNRTRIVDATGNVTAIEYDARDLPVRRVSADGLVTSFFHDDQGALTCVTYPSGESYSFTHDEHGNLTGIHGAQGWLWRFEYDARHNLVAETDARGARTTTTHDGMGRPVTRTDALGRTTRVTYDKGGRVARIDDARWGATVYAHDKVDQLVEARRGAYREVFAYDAAGSLQKMLEGLDAEPQAAPAWEIQPGNLVTRTGEAKYSYDKRGRRTGTIELSRFANGAKPTRDDITQYFWDFRDRLREVMLAGGTRVVMTYDAFGRRVRKEVVPKSPAERSRVVEFVWDGNALAADLDTERGARCFVHEPGTLIPLLQQERGEVFTYVNDHLGMPKELIDPAGMVAWTAAHSAWGKVVETTADRMGEMNRGHKVESPFRLLGQVADEETGLCWTRFRCFDPEVGRWCSPDPLGIFGGGNLFGFVRSPTIEIDPLGLAPEEYRGIMPGQTGHEVRDNDFRSPNPATGAQGRGISTFSTLSTINPERHGIPHRVVQESIPEGLAIEQRGRRQDH